MAKTTASKGEEGEEEGGGDGMTASLPVPMFHLLGIVKEIGVDDLGLMEFSNDYFAKAPIYLDVPNAIYTAFGKRSIFRAKASSWNPITIYRSIVSMGRRLSAQNITGNYKGEGLIQGGILLFDSTGTLRYSINEDIGTPFHIDTIIAALQDITSTTTANTNTANTTITTEETVNEEL